MIQYFFCIRSVPWYTWIEQTNIIGWIYKWKCAPFLRNNLSLQTFFKRQDLLQFLLLKFYCSTGFYRVLTTASVWASLGLLQLTNPQKKTFFSIYSILRLALCIVLKNPIRRWVFSNCLPSAPRLPQIPILRATTHPCFEQSRSLPMPPNGKSALFRQSASYPSCIPACLPRGNAHE